MMRFRIFRTRFKLLGIMAIAMITIILVLSVVGPSERQASAKDTPWNNAADSAPPELLTQIRAEILSPNAPVDVGRMRVWAIQQPGQTQPLYLIDSRIANAAQNPAANPLCGTSSCAFFGYLNVMNSYQQVLNIYLDPRLPPDVSLIELGNSLEAGLPILKVNQLDNDRIRQLTLTFNGQKYEVTETQLFPQRYE